MNAVRLTPLRLWHLPLLYYWRRHTVPPEALGNPKMSVVRWFFGAQRSHVVSCIIRVYDVPVGYVQVTKDGDLGIYIGVKEARGAGFGRVAVRLAVCRAAERGVRTLTCGTNIPEFFMRCGFRFSGRMPVVENGVLRYRMYMHLDVVQP